MLDDLMVSRGKVYRSYSTSMIGKEVNKAKEDASRSFSIVGYDDEEGKTWNAWVQVKP